MAGSPHQATRTQSDEPKGRPGGGRPTIEKPDVAERGGNGQTLDRRLFMQLQRFGGCGETAGLAEALGGAGVEAVLYEDVNDPRGVALLTWSEDPSHFVEAARSLFNTPPFNALQRKPAMTMIGRTYSIGYEPDLEEWLLQKPRRTVRNPDWPWAIWYPLRRSGAFEQLPADEQRAILMEHGVIGRGFGEADLAHDVRLACHGLDERDNDFLIGLVGKDLHPLSAIVQTMRKTKQTSQYLSSLGPFFVGRAVWYSSSV